MVSSHIKHSVSIAVRMDMVYVPMCVYKLATTKHYGEQKNTNAKINFG